jgi:hypothetical protein
MTLIGIFVPKDPRMMIIVSCFRCVIIYSSFKFQMTAGISRRSQFQGRVSFSDNEHWLVFRHHVNAAS